MHTTYPAGILLPTAQMKTSQTQDRRHGQGTPHPGLGSPLVSPRSPRLCPRMSLCLLGSVLILSALKQESGNSGGKSGGTKGVDSLSRLIREELKYTEPCGDQSFLFLFSGNAQVGSSSGHELTALRVRVPRSTLSFCHKPLITANILPRWARLTPSQMGRERPPRDPSHRASSGGTRTQTQAAWRPSPSHPGDPCFFRVQACRLCVHISRPREGTLCTAEEWSSLTVYTYLPSSQLHLLERPCFIHCTSLPHCHRLIDRRSEDMFLALHSSPLIHACVFVPAPHCPGNLQLCSRSNFLRRSRVCCASATVYDSLL